MSSRVLSIWVIVTSDLSFIWVSTPLTFRKLWRISLIMPSLHRPQALFECVSCLTQITLWWWVVWLECRHLKRNCSCQSSCKSLFIDPQGPKLSTRPSWLIWATSWCFQLTCRSVQTVVWQSAALIQKNWVAFVNHKPHKHSCSHQQFSPWLCPIYCT